MNGIQFVTDAKGRKVAVLIDLKKYGTRLQEGWAYFGETAQREGHSF
jgi:hypothetical protein